MFLRLATGSPEHYVVLDARRPVEEITAAIQARLQPLLVHASRAALDPRVQS
jgi:dTMP kinase